MEQRRFRSRHLIPMFIGTPCIVTIIDARTRTNYPIRNFWSRFDLYQGLKSLFLLPISLSILYVLNLTLLKPSLHANSSFSHKYYSQVNLVIYSWVSHRWQNQNNKRLEFRIFKYYYKVYGISNFCGNFNLL